MAEKKSSEGIALLSMYGDEDDEMEDLDEEGENIPPPALDVATGKESGGVAVNKSESAGAVMNSDPLDKFLPLPPTAKCSDQLQDKISKFISIKKTSRRSFNAEVRNRKEYRNPDFLLHAVTYQDIDQIGSCFQKDVFNPHGYDKSDFYDELEADMRRELQRKKNHNLDFTPGGVHIPTPGLTAGALNVTSAASDVNAREGRPNKKSKWDVDQRTTGGQNLLARHRPFILLY